MNLVIFDRVKINPPWNAVGHGNNGAGIIQGDGSDPVGNGDIINLIHEQVRTLVFIYRGGGFDRKLEAAGMETAV